MNKNLDKPALSENDIQNSILELLRWKKICAWRNNNGAVYDIKSGHFRKKNKWEKIAGSPVDILGILPDGKFLAIEVKRDEREKPSEGQKEFLQNISSNQGIAFVAHSLSCVRLHLKRYF
ncbi:MAG: hypothetical protein ACTSRU_02115 [Candidatus Hodarchaeales archaeon]